jgi:hypothetical protein
VKTLLAYLCNHFDFLYLNPQYRITDSGAGGNATDTATLRFSGPLASFWFSNERGRIFCDVAPTKLASQENWFRIPIVRQYLDGLEEANAISAKEAADWVRENFARIEDLFTDEAVGRSCEEMTSLERISAQKRFGPA